MHLNLLINDFQKNSDLNIFLIKEITKFNVVINLPNQ
jgi:hypothetical protein